MPSHLNRGVLEIQHQYCSCSVTTVDKLRFDFMMWPVVNLKDLRFVLGPTTLSNSRLKNAWTIDIATSVSRQKAIAQSCQAHELERPSTLPNGAEPET